MSSRGEFIACDPTGIPLADNERGWTMALAKLATLADSMTKPQPLR